MRKGSRGEGDTDKGRAGAPRPSFSRPSPPLPLTRPPRVLAIAGSDCSGGAGIQADIKTITMLGGYAMSAITAITAQNTRGVARIEPLDPALVAAQIDACCEDIGVEAVKIGLLASADIAEVVADRVEALACPIIFDPVLVATSGAMLADPASIEIFDWLMELATLTTPNVSELAALGGPEAMAARLGGRGVVYLAKGGDAEGPLVEDRLVRPGEADVIWREARILTRHSHGSGCTLSSAIATCLAAGAPIEEAICTGRSFVRAAMLAAPGFGAGHGPMGHQAVRAPLPHQPATASDRENRTG